MMVIYRPLLASSLIALWCSVLAALPPDFMTAAREAIGRGDTEGAIRLTTQAIEATPKNAAAYSLRAAINDDRREFEKALADYSQLIELAPNSADAYQRRGEAHFRTGHFKESVADFDRVIELNPDRAPYHWQRGISLYYAGEFDRGAKQFELHKTVNPEDVENAVWHYLCVARMSGSEKARQGLIPIRDDGRVPMMQVFAMFSGMLTPDDVLRAATAGAPAPEQLRQRLFYAHLYVGLFFEAAGKKDRAREHILLAAEKYEDSGYMGDVARAHAALLKQAAKEGMPK